MKRPYSGVLLLCLYPFSRGYAFVLFEGPGMPCDWGIKEVKEKHRNVKMMESVKNLIEKYHPEVLVIESSIPGRYRRSARIKKFYQLLPRYALSEHIDLHRISMPMVKRHFAERGAKTKHDIARLIGQELSLFAHRLPRVRKAWMGPDPRQSLFDAASLGIFFYKTRGVPSPYDGADR